MRIQSLGSMESTVKHSARLMVIAFAGVGTSLAAVVHFVLAVFNNRIPWHTEAREFYLAVGRSYTQGFAIGFFLCFSLAVAATAVVGTLEQLRNAPEPAPVPVLGKRRR